jgi:hypothetical protein
MHIRSMDVRYNLQNLRGARDSSRPGFCDVKSKQVLQAIVPSDQCLTSIAIPYSTPYSDMSGRYQQGTSRSRRHQEGSDLYLHLCEAERRGSGMIRSDPSLPPAGGHVTGLANILIISVTLWLSSVLARLLVLVRRISKARSTRGPAGATTS